jgi:SAM-dependent methyltransferase
MLHHVPTAELQDRLFAEAFRVLRPGGVFAGSDSVTSLRFRILHFRDTCNTVSPQTLPDRLHAAGFHGVDVEVHAGRQRWRAVKAA